MGQLQGFVFMNKQRFFGLDLMRALAISLVLFAHGFELLIPNGSINWNKPCGFLGVELFFVLSGFLIGGILIKIFSKKHFQFQDLKRFWIRRWWRSLPNYFLFLFIYLGFHSVFQLGSIPKGADLMSYFVFLQNSLSPHPGFYPIAWSLSIEEWFYLSFPVLLWLCHLLGLKSLRLFLSSAVLVIGVCLCARIILSGLADLSWGPWYRKMIFWRLDAIVYGVLAACVFLQYPDWVRRWRFTSLILGCVVLTLSLIPFWRDYVLHDSSGFFLKTVFFDLVSISIALMLPAFYHMRRTSLNLVDVSIEGLSKISYSVYLSHWIFVLLFFNVVALEPGIISFWFFIGCTLGLSILVYKLFEKPTTQLREKWS